MLEPLPIDPYLPELRARLTESRAAVVVAAPGAGKTTRVGPALAEDGPVLLLEPRRIAARALARRIADERGWTLGREVGWHVRHERNFGRDTRLVIATEGILTRRLQGDPLLSDFKTLILDEFHERGLHGDLGLALARHAARARGDLAIVVMSATLDAGPIAAYLGDCPVLDVPGRLYPVEVSYAPHSSPLEAVARVLGEETGHLLCFLPGAPEIHRLAHELERRTLPGRPTSILPLYGALSAEQQDAALAPSGRRKLILATNVAETSLTVEGVTDVVDSGLHKVLRRDEGLGIDRLELERIPADCAAQRAGRAGRTAPGRALRLWDARDELRPRREPEILRVDLAQPLLEVLAWGGDPASFDWFEAPPQDALAQGLELLARLGAVERSRITARGRRLHRLPLHPRLATVLLDAGRSRTAAAACAALAEGMRLTTAAETTSSDALALADRVRQAPAHVRRAADELAREAAELEAEEPAEAAVRSDDERLRRALLAAYPERVARRRAPGSPRLLLASGHGAVLAPESGVREAEFLVALDVAAAARGRGGEALVRLASRVEPEWLEPTRVEVEHRFDEPSASIRAVERTLHGALSLRERPVAPEPEVAERMLAEILRERGPDAGDRLWLARARFAGLELDHDALGRQACAGRTTLPTTGLSELVPHDTRRQLERLAPETLLLPSGRRVPLDYREDGTVHAQAKLQELFGLAETPRLGPRSEPVTFSLLAPNGRPVQTTRDLRSFWDRTYPEVRKELRGRYPKHPWPDDPWAATPTASAKRRR